MGNKADAKYHELMAHWWMASAVSGHCKQRDMFHGIGQGDPFTDSSKRKPTCFSCGMNFYNT